MQFFPHFIQVPVLSPALTVTRSFAHQATGKHTLLLTSKAYSRRSTSSLEKLTRPKCPRVTYLCLTSPCRNPSSSRTLVRACVHRHIWAMLHLCSQLYCWNVSLSCFLVDVSSCECVFFAQIEMSFHMKVHLSLVHMLLNRSHTIPEPSLGFPTVPGGGGQ